MGRPGKRNRKFLGSKSHGKGNAKNKRGKGNKGGWGRAGMHKHRFSHITVYERDWMAHGGRFGFYNNNPTHKKMDTLNLFEIDQKVVAGEIPTKDGKLTLDFDGKILGTGPIHHAVLIRARAASEKAIERLSAAGGKFEQVGGKKEEARLAQKAAAKPAPTAKK